MKSSTAHRVILLSAMLTFAVGWFDSAQNGKNVPPAKFLIGGGVAFLVISAIADVEPQLGGAFALAIATTVFLSKTDPLLSYMNVPAQSAGRAAKDTKTATENAIKTPIHTAAHP